MKYYYNRDDLNIVFGVCDQFEYRSEWTFIYDRNKHEPISVTEVLVNPNTGGRMDIWYPKEMADTLRKRLFFTTFDDDYTELKTDKINDK